MIVNLPTYDGLNAAALKLYFRAWYSIIEMLHEFDQHFPSDEPFNSKSGDGWKEERQEYLAEIQEDLQAVLVIVQQSNELALKARIASISPYLLLLNSEMPLSTTVKEVDFATLRTIDAVDLPKAVNSLCPDPLTPSYVKRYGELRILRNQYAHLGNTSVSLDPSVMLGSMAEQYLELWPERAWHKDRVELGSSSREGFFEGKHWSRRQEAMFLLEHDRAFIPATTFKKLFKVNKSALKFACHSCLDDWAISRNGPDAADAKTSYYKGKAKVMHCVMCDADYAAVARTCAQVGCTSKFAAPDDAEYGPEACFGCGHTPEDHSS